MSTSRWSESKSVNSKLYGTVYSTYELPGTRIYRDNEIHHGLVSLADGSSPGKPARLELTSETLIIQVPQAIADQIHDIKEQQGFVGENARLVTINRHPDSGFGFAIKGGGSGTCRAPIVISKVWRDQENIERHKQVLIGDTIIELNGISVENKSHDEVVQMLKETGDKVQLKLKYQKDIAGHLLRGSYPRSRASSLDRPCEAETISSMASYQSVQTYGTADAPKGWKTILKISLPMAYITRYLWGTDKIRPNAFEVRAVDGTSSGLIFCEDEKVVDLWTQYMSKNIVRLNNKSIKLSNKFLHHDQLIVYLGWVCEKSDDSNNSITPPGNKKEFWQSWQPKFLILKGSEICLFESPPLNTEDLSKCIFSYRIIETRFKDIKEFEQRDERKFVFDLETSMGTRYYFSVESKAQLDQLRFAWHRAVYYTINRIQSKTFACNVEDRPSGLVFDIKYGIGLYDIHRKKYVWRYKFPMLRSSCDDGKMRVRLVFRNQSAPQEPHIVDMDCSDLYPLIYTLHSFLLTRIISVGPDFIEMSRF